MEFVGISRFHVVGDSWESLRAGRLLDYATMKGRTEEGRRKEKIRENRESGRRWPPVVPFGKSGGSGELSLFPVKHPKTGLAVRSVAIGKDVGFARQSACQARFLSPVIRKGVAGGSKTGKKSFGLLAMACPGFGSQHRSAVDLYRL